MVLLLLCLLLDTKCLCVLLQNTDKRLMFGYWSSFIPDTQGGATMASAQTLFTIILKDPAPKVGYFAVVP